MVRMEINGKREGIFTKVTDHLYRRYREYTQRREYLRAEREKLEIERRKEMQINGFLDLLITLKKHRDSLVEYNIRNQRFSEINSFLVESVKDKFTHTANIDVPENRNNLSTYLTEISIEKPLDLIDLVNEYLKLRTVKTMWFSSSYSGLVDHRKSWLVDFYIQLCLNHVEQIKSYSRNESDSILPKRGEMIAIRIRTLVDLYTKCMNNIDVDTKIAPNKEMLDYVYRKIIDHIDKEFRSTGNMKLGYLKIYLEKSLYNDLNPGYEIPIKNPSL